jgi:hypothetical protein
VRILDLTGNLGFTRAAIDRLERFVVLRLILFENTL